MTDSDERTVARSLAVVREHGCLDREMSRHTLSAILHRPTPAMDRLWVALFASIATRGEDREEILGFLDAVEAYDPWLAAHRAESVDGHRPLVTITGSGKELFSTFNVSTTAAFVAAACGVRVLKPCSTASSAVTGSSELIRALGLRLAPDLPSALAQAVSWGVGLYEFSAVAPRMYARYTGLFSFFHPLSFVLAPFCLGYRPDYLVFGVANRAVAFGGGLLGALGFNGCTVCTDVGGGRLIDEFVPHGTVHLTHFSPTNLQTRTVHFDAPSDRHLETIAQRDTHAGNAHQLLDVLRGANPPAAHAVAHNAALLLEGVGIACGADAFDRAMNAMTSGLALQLLERAMATHAKV
jgi:anthranilate phosphoribosyltransferase